MSLLSKDELCQILQAEIGSGRYAIEFNRKMNVVLREIQQDETTIEYSNTLLAGLYNWVSSFCLTGNEYAEFGPKSSVDYRNLKKCLDTQLAIAPERDRLLNLIYALGKEGIFHLPDDFNTVERPSLLGTPMPKLQELAPNFLPSYQFLTQLNKKISYYEQRRGLFEGLDDENEKAAFYWQVREYFITARDNYIQGYKEGDAKENCLKAILTSAKGMQVSLKINEERSWFMKIINAIIAFCTGSETEVEEKTWKVDSHLNFFANPTATTQTAKDLSEILNAQYAN